ncbi:hypothetical protein MJ1_0596 [Nanobdella aerobiophila]|uniref:Archaeal Type IV pilin N-terminal domain-containing protein n=1 Tax=Nanobdella aerobiophila TaxID=2586965 RepID=A0A915WSB0_9ARCH|nr:archaellin/type IV pilin N-terminal domain-containing protein [Nanobdella aerobiophila]BBL45746.1 hypothetical protein MJ1_0596 [Nanobdella aerobiophila]
MKGISPIIATILLIVMTVAIAGLMYAWLSGLFSTLTTSTSNQVSRATQTVSFSIPNTYVSGSNIYAVIYNNGNVPIVPSSMVVDAGEYYTANQSYDGNTYTCNINQVGSTPGNSTAIPTGSQNTLELSCNSTIVNNIISGNGTYYYILTFTYGGVAEQATLT